MYLWWSAPEFRCVLGLYFDALSLPGDARVDLAEALLESVDHEPGDEGAEMPRVCLGAAASRLWRATPQWGEAGAPRAAALLDEELREDIRVAPARRRAPRH
jgi:hypothetical protein